MEECPICMDIETESPVIHTMCCKTPIHNSCMNTCVQYNPNNGCPFCRTKIEDVPIEKSNNIEMGKACGTLCCGLSFIISFTYVCFHAVFM